MKQMFLVKEKTAFRISKLKSQIRASLTDECKGTRAFQFKSDDILILEYA